MLHMQPFERGVPFIMPTRSRGSASKERKTVVDRALEHENVGGSPSELARQLSKLSGQEITRQRVWGWQMRGTFPREMLVYVSELIGIPIEELIVAKPRDRDKGSVVDKAIRLLGEGSSAAKFAEELSKASGRRITRQQVNNWQVAEQFPVNVVPFVHILTRIPVRELIAPRRGRKKVDGSA